MEKIDRNRIYYYKKQILLKIHAPVNERIVVDSISHIGTVRGHFLDYKDLSVPEKKIDFIVGTEQFFKIFSEKPINNNKTNVMEIYQKIRNLRKTKNISQEKLADFIGMSRSKYVNLEAGRTLNIPIKVGEKIAEMLDTSFDDLFEIKQFGIKPKIEQQQLPDSKSIKQTNEKVNEISNPISSSALIESVIKSKEVKCFIFTPNNEFYNTIEINQKRWGQIYRGEIEPTIVEAKNIADYFEFPVIKFFEH